MWWLLVFVADRIKIKEKEITVFSVFHRFTFQEDASMISPLLNELLKTF